MRLTRRGSAVLAGAAVCYLVGELAGYPVFRALAGVAVGGVLAAVGIAMSRPKVEISRTVHPDRIERGKPALATLVIRNPTTRRHGGFAAGDRIGQRLHRIQVRPLAPGASATYHYELPTTERGRLQVGPHVLNRHDPFDLVHNGLTTGGTTDLWVYPRRHAMRPAHGGHPRHHHEGPITDPPLRGSLDLRAVRPYVPGDEIRYLHWKATARTGQLMVREYADPAQLRLTTVLDTRPAALTPAAFEEAVDVAASVLYASAAAGQHCRLITSGGVDTPVDSGLRVARALLDQLCVVTQDGSDDGAVVPRSLATSRPGGAVVVITGPQADLGPAREWLPDNVIRVGVDWPAETGGGTIMARDAADAAAKWNALRAGAG